MPLRAWSIADVRAAEAAAMADLPEGTLMARAAKGLALVVAARLPEHPGARIVGLVGSGGNGGDTLYALARLAKMSRKDAAAGAERIGAVAAVLITRDPRGSVHPGGLAAARKAGVTIATLGPDVASSPALTATLHLIREADIVLDGIAGIGGRPGWPPDLTDVIEDLVDAIPTGARIIAVDLPSGADPDGRDPSSPGIWADETVTFGVPKPVHVLATAGRCGTLTVVDIGLRMTTDAVCERFDHDDVGLHWPVPGPGDDKYSRGVLGIVAGGDRYTGAAVLAVTAAVCSGAGMVRYVGPPAPTALVRALVPEAVIGAPTGAERVQAWVVGPGLDAADVRTKAGAAQVAAAREALDSGLPAVVDAGGLDLLDGPRPGAGARTLLTPHAGELARLLTRLGEREVTRADVVADPLAHAQAAASLLHATILLKGSTTYLVPPPDRGLPTRAQADAPAWLATAGAGDVLAGLAGTLLAAGLDPLDAGTLAALVHGVAATEVNPGGPVRALDVAHALGGAVGRLLARH